MQNSGVRVVVLGMMGRTPFAGVAWQVLHYLEGLRRLGYDVHYVEDTGAWPYDPERNTVTDDCSYTVRYLARLMAWCGMPDRWAYRSATDGQIYGLSAARLSKVIRAADALLNLTGATVLREEHLSVPVRIYLETDPVRPQIEVAQGVAFTTDLLGAHTHHFTYGENVGTPDCLVPVGRFRYEPTRQPVVMDWWAGTADAPGDGRFTTVANWKQAGKDVQWRGETYTWSKHHEFLKFVELPRRSRQPFELALACGDQQAIDLLRRNGWRVVDAVELSRDVHPYRDYILSSRAEFTVAKDQNVRLATGWFSDRSACYLAAGKPVITQDTAFGRNLPTGCGLFAFRAMDDILAALEQIASDYEAHSRAARAIAREHFAADRVLASLMRRAGLQ